MPREQWKTIDLQEVKNFPLEDVYVVTDKFTKMREEPFGYILSTYPHTVTNEMGREIFDICNLKRISEIIDIFYSKYDVDRDKLQDDILIFLLQLGKVGALFFVSQEELQKHQGKEI